jgi:hypothetical protein
MVTENNKLSSFADIVHDLSEKYSTPYEVVESILIDWMKLLYDNISYTDLSDFEA